jgi:hypothetical protein
VLVRRISRVWIRLRGVAETLAAYSAAAAMYRDLARLSDAELRRRGLSRPHLARDILVACERLQCLGWFRRT